MPKPDDMLEGKTCLKTTASLILRIGVSRVEAVPTDHLTGSQAIGPFDAGKRFLGMFLPDLIAGALVVPESWARHPHLGASCGGNHQKAGPRFVYQRHILPAP